MAYTIEQQAYVDAANAFNQAMTQTVLWGRYRNELGVNSLQISGTGSVAAMPTENLAAGLKLFAIVDPYRKACASAWNNMGGKDRAAFNNVDQTSVGYTTLRTAIDNTKKHAGLGGPAVNAQLDALVSLFVESINAYSVIYDAHAALKAMEVSGGPILRADYNKALDVLKSGRDGLETLKATATGFVDPFPAVYSAGVALNDDALKIASRLSGRLVDAIIAPTTSTGTVTNTQTGTTAPAPSQSALDGFLYTVQVKADGWRKALTRARQLESDAQNMNAALSGILQQYRAAGPGFTQQVDTLNAMIAACVANVDFARQAQSALSANIAQAERILATRDMTLAVPSDPAIALPPPLPATLPAGPNQQGPTPVQVARQTARSGAVASPASNVVKGKPKSPVVPLTVIFTLLNLFS